MTASNEAMRIEGRKTRLEAKRSDVSASRFDDVNMSGCEFENVKMSAWRVHNADLSRSKFDDVNISGCEFENVNMSAWRVHNANLAGLNVVNANLAGASIVDARLEGATIDGISVTELLSYWRAGHRANGA